MRRVIVGLALLGAGAAVNAQQEGSNWAVSVGATYRSFSDVSLNARQFSNPAASADDYVNGGQNSVAGLFGVLDNRNANDPAPALRGQNDDVGGISLDTIAVGEHDESLDDSVGAAVGANLALTQCDNFVVGLQLGFSAAGSHTRDRMPGVVTSDLWATVAGTATNGGGRVAVPHPGAVLPPGGVGTGFATTNGYLDMDLDLDVYVLDAGLTGALQLGSARFGVGMGPTLTLADLDLDLTEVVDWNADGARLYSRRLADTTQQALLGVYFSAGVSCDVTERLGVGVEYRHDHVFSELESTYADIDLNGGTTQLKVTYRF